MISAAEIRNVKFTKSMGGYKQEEVDVLLDRIEADYAQFDRAVKEYRAKIEAMNKEIESLGEERFFHADYEATLLDTYGAEYSERACFRAEACRPDC